MAEEKSPLDRMIELSIEILKIKIIQTYLKHLCFCATRLSHNLASLKYVKYFEIELDHKRKEFEGIIYKYANKCYPDMLDFNEEYAHFTLNELKRGYYVLNDHNILILSEDKRGEIFMEEQLTDVMYLNQKSAIKDKDLQLLTLLKALKI